MDFNDDEGFEELMERQGETGLLEEDSDLEEITQTGPGSESNQLEDEEEIDQTELKLRSLNTMNKNHNRLDKNEQHVKNQILMLCSALGGVDPSSPTNEYILGTDAYGCLKDIKTWLRKFEERNSWLVASFCHDTGLFVNDLVPIMVQMGEIVSNDPNSSFLKVVLIALELMVKLTSPIIVIEDEDENEEQLIFYMKMKLAQVEYKHRLLNYNNGQILKNVLNIAIPLLKMDKKDLVKRDNVILNLCITLFVNILRIEPSATFKTNSSSSKRSVNVIETIPTGVTKEDISLDKVLVLFDKFKVLTFVQTVASNLTTEFETTILGYACMDFYYYLYVGINPETIAKPKITFESFSKSDKSTEELSSSGKTLLNLLKTEDKRKKTIFAHRATRHANFGTLLKIKDGSNKYRTVSGQSKLMNDSLLDVMDNNTSKETKRIGSHVFREKKSNKDDRLTERVTHIDRHSTILLQGFTRDFLENSFNNLCREFDRKILSSPDKDIHETMVARYHYLFIINWVLKYQRFAVGSQKKTIPNMKKYKFIVYAISSELIEKLFVVYLNVFQKNYPMLRMIMKCIQEIVLCAMDLHSFNKLTSEKLLESDLKDVKAYVVSAEGTLRGMFKSKDRIKIICDLPRDAQKVSLAHAEMAIEFTSVILKFFKYTQSLKIPLMLIKNKDPEDDKLQYISFDHTLVNMFTNVLLQEKVVSLHIWLFIRWNNFEEKKIIRCLNYFSLLLNEGWEAHIFKLLRLDFMLALFNLRKANFSKITMMGFGKLLDRFMHLFSKLHSNTKCVLLEPMTLLSTTNSSLIDYYLTGDPFLDTKQNRIDNRFDDEQRFVDVTFLDSNIDKYQKIALVVTRLLYDDNEHIIRDLIKTLQQWIKEFNGDILLEEEIIVRPKTFKLFHDTLQAAKNQPYFRLLCELVGIKHARLIEKSSEILKENCDILSSSVDTPLDQHQLENKFNDPNTQRTRLHNDGDDRADGYYGEGIINDDDDDLAGNEDLENDPLALLEAQLSSLEKREKGKVMKKTRDGDLVEMGKKVKKKKKKSTEEKKRKSSSRKGGRTKKRRVLVDDNEDLSDNEIERRKHLSKARIEDSDEEFEDSEFFEREMKLQAYLQKKRGKITRDDYEKLMKGKLDIDSISEEEDNIFIDQDTQTQNTENQRISNPISNEFVGNSSSELDSELESESGSSDSNSDSESASNSESESEIESGNESEDIIPQVEESNVTYNSMDNKTTADSNNLQNVLQNLSASINSHPSKDRLGSMDTDGQKMGAAIS